MMISNMIHLPFFKKKKTFQAPSTLWDLASLLNISNVNIKKSLYYFPGVFACKTVEIYWLRYCTYSYCDDECDSFSCAVRICWFIYFFKSFMYLSWLAPWKEMLKELFLCFFWSALLNMNLPTLFLYPLSALSALLWCRNAPSSLH